jgi:uncharacterized protein YjiS (DUF1127 family)
MKNPPTSLGVFLVTRVFKHSLCWCDSGRLGGMPPRGLYGVFNYRHSAAGKAASVILTLKRWHEKRRTRRSCLSVLLRFRDGELS